MNPIITLSSELIQQAESTARTSPAQTGILDSIVDYLDLRKQIVSNILIDVQEDQPLTLDWFWSFIDGITTGIEIRSDARETLGELLEAGVEKMRQENRTSRSDTAKAAGSLTAFVLKMRFEARELGHEDWIDGETVRAAAIRFQTMKITLWPFIPPPWAKR